MMPKMLIMAALAAMTAGANLHAAEKLAAVQDGKALAVRYSGGDWKEAADGLESPKECKFLYAAQNLAAGDFRISARLKLHVMEATAAAFTINDSRLGFDGKGGKLFIEGPLFAEQKLSLEAAGIRPKAGQMFELEIVREKGVTQFLIDKHEVLRMDKWDGPAGRIGFRPHRNQMTIRQFEIQGNLVDPPKPLGTPVFTSGQDGYHGYRIPALAVTSKGTVLAVCEGRKQSFSDTGDIDLVLRRSTDGGKTWSPLQVIWDDKDNTCGNPCLVTDRQTGMIWLLSTWNLGGDHESGIIAGKSRDTRRVFVMSSEDDGLTWSKPVEITSAVKKPTWSWYATGPGSGIQMVNGPHKGRMVIPCDHIEKDTGHHCSHVFYSDDHGKSWKLGGTTSDDKVNECEVVELADGKMMLNMRNYGAKRNRQIALSDDGGETWKDLRQDETLIEPVCQAAVERYRWPEQDKPGIILFSNPASTSGRVRMTVRASMDDGKTWPLSRLLNEGPSAYSDLAVLPDGQVACLYEGGSDHSYQYILFASFPLSSLSPAGEKPAAKE